MASGSSSRKRKTTATTIGDKSNSDSGPSMKKARKTVKDKGKEKALSGPEPVYWPDYFIEARLVVFLLAFSLNATHV